MLNRLKCPSFPSVRSFKRDFPYLTQNILTKKTDLYRLIVHIPPFLVLQRKMFGHLLPFFTLNTFPYLCKSLLNCCITSFPRLQKYIVTLLLNILFSNPLHSVLTIPLTKLKYPGGHLIVKYLTRPYLQQDT